MNDLSGMSERELEELVASLQADLEDLEEERSFVLGQTGVHLSVSVVARYDRERALLKEKIEEAQAALRARVEALGAHIQALDPRAEEQG